MSTLNQLLLDYVNSEEFTNEEESIATSGDFFDIQTVGTPVTRAVGTVSGEDPDESVTVSLPVSEVVGGYQRASGTTYSCVGTCCTKCEFKDITDPADGCKNCSEAARGGHGCSGGSYCNHVVTVST